jgi:hypothetical protein
MKNQNHPTVLIEYTSRETKRLGKKYFFPGDADKLMLF